MKTKSNKKLIVLGLVVTMFALYGIFPLPDGAQAVNSLTDASATLSDSDLGVIGTTTISVTTATNIPAGGTLEAAFHGDFSVITANANITCSDGTESGGTTRTAVCTMGSLIATGTTLTITVDTLTNPVSDGDRTIEVTSYNAASVALDRITLMVYIIEDVLMTATVNPILEFTITGVLIADGKTVNGVACDDADTTSTSTPFGTLDPIASTTICQQLNVQTNADDGYVVTVEQDQEMTSDSGSNINSFNNSANGAGSTTAEVWAVPNNTLDEYHTYGHMGLTSDDADLNSLGSHNSFAPSDTDGATQYVGLNGTDTMTVMHHNGPSDGTTQDIGEAFVAYTAEIGSLQEAGDYESTLTYIATPTY